MKTIKINLPREVTKLEIVPLSDWHIGDSNCNITEIKKYIEYIKEHENVYCILNGDLINNATKNSVSDIYSEKLSPKEQMDLVYELLLPIKEKILAVTEGNHELRTYREDGQPLIYWLTKMLGLEDKYAPETAVIFIKLGQKTKEHKTQQMQYSIFISHGCRGGRRVGSKANAIEDMSNIIDADIYICGHSHQSVVFKENFLRTNLTHQQVTEVSKLFVNAASFLSWGGYGERFLFRPSNNETPTIVLSGTERAMKAVL